MGALGRGVMVAYPLQFNIIQTKPLAGLRRERPHVYSTTNKYEWVELRYLNKLEVMYRRQFARKGEVLTGDEAQMMAYRHARTWWDWQRQVVR